MMTKEIYTNQYKSDIAHHKLRIEAIKTGKLNHLPGYYRCELLDQSERIIKNPELGYNSCQCKPPC